jgi:mRNA interferase MazF
MNCSRNEVVLLPFPFTDLSGRKVRPAVVLGQQGADVFLVPISAQLHNTTYALREWRAAGLNVACGIKTQIATVDCGLIVKSVGQLAAVDVARLNQLLRTWLNL